MLISLLSFGQKYAYAKTKETNVRDTVITVDSKQFDCFVSVSSGAVWYYRTSKKGNTYRWYLGYLTDDTFDSKPVWRNVHETKFWVLKIKAGNLGRKYVYPIRIKKGE